MEISPRCGPSMERVRREEMSGCDLSPGERGEAGTRQDVVPTMPRVGVRASAQAGGRG